MKPKKIIAAISSQGGGKDFLMNRLQKRLIFKSDVVRFPKRCRFADSLNEAVSAILGVSVKELQNRSLKEVKRFGFENPDWTQSLYSSRDVQKKVASLFRKALGSRVFINALANKYEGSDDILIISDLRYENELEWVRDNGGIVVYIDNEKATEVQKSREMHESKVGYESAHYPPESEHLMWNVCNREVDVDYRLDNNDFRNEKPFDDFVQFVLKYLEQ